MHRGHNNGGPVDTCLANFFGQELPGVELVSYEASDRFGKEVHSESDEEEAWQKSNVGTL